MNTEVIVPKKRSNFYDQFRNYWMGKSKPKTDEQVKRLGIYKHVFHLLVQGHNRTDVSDLVAKEYEVSKSNAFKYIRDVDSIVGKFEETNQKAEKYIAAERWLRLAKKAEDRAELLMEQGKDKEAGIFMEKAIDCYRNHDKIKSLFDPITESNMNPDDYVRPQMIQFVVVSDHEPKTLDIEHETVEKD
jgi:hypothetical protein